MRDLCGRQDRVVREARFEFIDDGARILQPGAFRRDDDRDR